MTDGWLGIGSDLFFLFLGHALAALGDLGLVLVVLVVAFLRLVLSSS